MNRLDNEKRAQVISCLIEGCSIRSTVRMTGVAKKTVMRVLVEVGEICADYQDRAHSATLPRGGSNSMRCGRGFIAKQHISK